MAMTIRGTEASVRWGYHLAAELASWELSAGTDRSQLTARVVQADPIKVLQRPLTFIVPRPKGRTWRFPVLSLQCADGQLSATLGPQEGDWS